MMLYTCLPHLPVSGSSLAYVLTLEYDTSLQEYHQSEKITSMYMKHDVRILMRANERNKKNKGLNEEKKI